MKSITGKEVLDAVKAAEQGMGDATIQPGIIANRNIAIEDAEELWSGHYNDSWSETINKKLTDGFIVFRIQTEWLEGYGHQTMIYMAKMKK